MYTEDGIDAALYAPERLAALNMFSTLGDVGNIAFERTARIVQAALHDPAVLISFIAPDRLLVQHQIGFSQPWNTAHELPLSWSYCRYVVLSSTEAVLVDTLHTIPVTPVPFITTIGYRASASVPLRTSNGQVIGALTVVDRHTRTWTTRETMLLHELADSLIRELELHLRLAVDSQTVHQPLHSTLPHADHQFGGDLLRPNEPYFRSICDSSPIGIFLTDVDGHCTYSNQRLQAILGYGPNDILGMHWSSIVHPDDCNVVLEQWHMYTQTDQQLLNEYRCVGADGQTRWLRAYHTSLRDNSGAIIGHIGTVEDITDQRQTEEALQTSELRFRAAVDQFPYTFIMYDAQLRIQFVNNYGLVRSGRAESELLGHTDIELFPKENIDTYLPLLERAKETRSVQSGQITIQFPDAAAHILVTYVPILASDNTLQQIMAITYDITAHQETAELLRRSEERYRILFESNPQPMWVFDRQTLAFLAVNEAALQHYGYSHNEFLAMTIKDIRPEADVPSLMRTFGQQPAPPHNFYQARHFKRDGTLIDVEIRAHQFDFDGRPAMLVLINDITERLRVDTERQAIERKLQETQKLESLGLLAGGIAHDFNNLLAAIMGNAGLALLDLSNNHPAHEPVAQIDLAARRAAELTQQMLAYAGRGHFAMQPLDLNILVVEMTSLLNASISKTVQLRHELVSDLPAVEADKTQLWQVVMNLVINASEAIGETNGSITVRTSIRQCDEAMLATVTGAAEMRPGQYIQLEVTDTGSGMDGNTISRIFDPFYSTKFVGRGLGLAAVQGIVRRHKGGIKVHSAIGEGTTFTILLPSAQQNIVEEATLRSQPEASDTRQEIILVVDDEESVRKLCARILERASYSVMTADGGQSGLATFEEHADAIHCVLLDLTMPFISGDQVLRAIREIRPSMPVVLMSGYNEQDFLIRYTALGATNFLQKPFTPQQLLSLVQRVVSESMGSEAV